MKVLYFGTICNLENYYDFVKNSRNIPSVASIVFESALLTGFHQNDVEMDIHCYPMVPTFPSCKHLYFGKQSEMLPCGFECKWLNTVNIPIFKQLSRRKDAKKIIRKWVKENRGNGVIMTYSIPPFLIDIILKYAKKNSIKVVPIITDLLRDMYINDSSNVAIRVLKEAYLKTALKLQGDCDGYIYLTEAMCEEVAPDKPYIVMEGIANITSNVSETIEKASPRAIMYAGALYEKYGIITLLNAFQKIKDSDIELWIFGDGTATADVKKFSEKDSRIKYFGSLPREKVLEYEKKATLLINPRNPNEVFTKYSFPSKTIEYMLSETPLLTTRLEGIPIEYFEYVFEVKDSTAEGLAKAIENILQYTDRELGAIGKRAREYVIENKNAKHQANRVIQFINGL